MSPGTGMSMSKQKFKIKDENRFQVIDAFRYFFFLVVSIFVASLVFDIVVAIVASVSGTPKETLDNSETVTILSTVMSPIVLIAYSLVYSKIRKVRLRTSFNDGQRLSLLPISVAIVLAIIAIFLFSPFMDLVEYGFMQLGYNPDPTIPLQEKMQSSIGYFFLGLLIYALLPAIAEEIVFRGVIQNSILSKYKGWIAISISTFLFVLMHGALQQTVYQLVMGIMLGYVACVGGSILYSIILHFLNNTFVILFSCFEIVPYLSENAIYYNIYSMIFPVCIFLLGVALAGILFWVLKYLRTKNFFRYEPKKKNKQVTNEDFENTKLGIKDLWKNSSYNEKVFALSGIVLVGIIWIINTISGFISS